MKRHTLLKHLKAHGCELLWEGEKHAMYHHPLERRTSAIPRHTEIANVLVRKICKDLGIIPPS
ncbi:MAG TPA: type II toxin-antitoxin system HicA family toxin [Thermomicrobiales bacterium]|nr:type II toxin-antitoxin system HicA family toxin [Thermomicrobiales bacterium]